MIMGNGRCQKVLWFSRNEFWKNIGCLVSDRFFGRRQSRLWDKEEDNNIRGKKRNSN